jgi:DnaJ-class molecular chaperone
MQTNTDHTSCLGSMADILGQFFGGDSPFGGGGGHPFGGLFGHSMGGGGAGGRQRRRKGDDIAHPLK